MDTSRPNCVFQRVSCGVSLRWLSTSSPAVAQVGDGANIDRRRGMSLRHTTPSSKRLDAPKVLDFGQVKPESVGFTALEDGASEIAEMTVEEPISRVPSHGAGSWKAEWTPK